MKEARESTLAYPAIEALALPITKDKQCHAHAFGIILRSISTNEGRWSLRYRVVMRICEIPIAANKRQFSVFSICPSPDIYRMTVQI